MALHYLTERTSPAEALIELIFLRLQSVKCFQYATNTQKINNRKIKQ